MNTTLTINWKGTSSAAITGLLISELPPITKPEMRVTRTEIDGRPGDIIDELGYSAYQKTIKIALTHGYDVDAVVKYLTGSGALILNNEPTRQYTARIVAGVDFDKLLRFKTATVKFEVQPYKKLVNEEATTLNITNQHSLVVASAGLEPSLPAIRLEGTGVIWITVGGLSVFSVNINEGYVIIDSETQEAYITGALKNNFMTGEFPTLQPGNNTIGWTGTLTKITVEPRSRWL